MQTLAQNYGFVNAIGAADQNAASLSKSNATYISMKGYNKVTFIIAGGAVGDAAWSANAYRAKSVSGSSISSTALGLTHYWTNKSSTGTTVLTRTTASSSKVTLDGTNSILTILEYDAKQCGSSYDCIGLAITNNATASTFVQVIAILHDARYAADGMPINALAD